MLSKPLVLSLMAIAALTGCLEAVDEAGVVTPGKAVTPPGTAVTTRNTLPTSRTIGPSSIVYGGGASTDVTLGGIDVSSPFATDTLNRNNVNRASATAYLSATGNFTTVVADVNPNASAGTYAAVSARSTGNASAATFGRFGTTTFPTGGTASYSGEYAGIAFENYSKSTQDAVILTTGNVSLVTSFTSNNVTGKITNRQVFDISGTRDSTWSAADVKINSATLDTNGVYSATTTGGELRQPGDTTTTRSGSVNGIIGGTNAQSTAGTLFLNHSLTSTAVNFVLTERGAFSATR